MSAYKNFSAEQKFTEYNNLKKIFEAYVAENLHLDMSRGKPGPEQLDLAAGMHTCLSENDYYSSGGIDCRNYGILDGLPEMKKIFADLLDVSVDEIILGGNSSLSMMFDNIASNVSHGVRDSIPWQRQGDVKFICPVPGYDRHFAICDYFHIKMIAVGMKPDGPDMDEVEKLVGSDPLIKGMWCVPVFSNPDGCIYSDEVIRRIANLKPAAHDFRIYWDNAYCVHHFRGEKPTIPCILRECEKSGNPHMPLVFASFSKISFSGAAVSAIATSKSNCDFIKTRLAIQTIGPDKLNQLRHVRFFGDSGGVYKHLVKIAEIIRPKFETVIKIFEKNLSQLEIADWTDPSGGYFISFNTLPGCAARAVSLCKDAGVTLTPAGSTYPYGNDPVDANIRIAPTYPTRCELEKAMEIFCVAVRIASLEKLLE